MKHFKNTWKFFILVIASILSPVSLTYLRPNFVLMVADDLGYGDVGFLGNTTIRTPNIDSIATQGAKLTHHLAVSAVCTPSRAAFLTGRYAIRSGMESSYKNSVQLMVATKGGLPANETTFAKILQKEKYATALIGKWHLGNDCDQRGDICHHPLSHGFDFFYGLPLTNLKDLGNTGESVVTSYFPNLYAYVTGTLAVGLITVIFMKVKNISWYWTCLVFVVGVIIPGMAVGFVCTIGIMNGIVLRNTEVVEQPVRLSGLTQRLVQEATEFIQHQASTENPFLLVVSFVHAHTALFTAPEFSGVSRHGPYGDNVEELDWGVGEILRSIRSLHLENRTFVYFSSDNGAHIEERGLGGVREGGYNGIFSGGKCMGGMEGGIRVPTAAMWPGKIPAGLEVSAPTSQMDIFTTILKMAGASIPGDRVIDGKDILPLLQGKILRSPHQFLFHYCGVDIHAARYMPEESTENAIWKVHYATPKWIPGTQECNYVCHCHGDHVQHHVPPLLYNIAIDPEEKHSIDVESHPRYHKVISILDKAVKAHQETVELVPNQFNFVNSMWRPWLQPCCNFPFCHCIDPKYPK